MRFSFTCDTIDEGGVGEHHKDTAHLTVNEHACEMKWEPLRLLGTHKHTQDNPSISLAYSFFK